MRSLLGAEYYTSPEVFEREQDRLFRKLWIFAGSKTLLVEPDSFITRTIGGVPIVVQNFAGTIKAFVNRCAHRQSAIQIGDHGVRRLACPYHGWVYDDDGKAASIPFCDTMYGFDADTRASRRLRSVAVACVGNLVFVCLADEPMPIEAQFDRAYLERLATVSSYLDDEVLLARFPAAFDWKLAFENVLDSHHVGFVHTRTFAPLLPKGIVGGGTASVEMIADADLPAGAATMSFESSGPMEVRAWPWHRRVQRFGDADAYYNWFIYPNVNFISIGGVVFLIQQFVPVASGRIEYHLWVATARQPTRDPATPAILWSQAKGEKAVIDEDVVVLEALQRGLNAGEPAFHGAYETRLRTLAKTYLGTMA